MYFFYEQTFVNGMLLLLSTVIFLIIIEFKFSDVILNMKLLVFFICVSIAISYIQAAEETQDDKVSFR